jgi:hypothetical protein
MSSNSTSYLDELEDIGDLLDRSVDPSEVEARLRSFNQKWSDVPPVKIVSGEIWNCAPFLQYGVRFTNKEHAINNLIASGMPISTNDEKFVEYLMNWIFYWSPSDPQHNDELGFQFLRWRFRHLGHLYPIFDNIMWPEVVAKIPLTGHVNDPFRMLLVGKDYYYIYNAESDIMFRAGKTLEEVYEGLKECKDGRSHEVCWEVMQADPPGWEKWWGFPCWEEDEEGGRWVLTNGILVEPFVPPALRRH